LFNPESAKAFFCPIVHIWQEQEGTTGQQELRKPRRVVLQDAAHGHIGHVSRGEDVAQAADVKLLLVLQPTTVSLTTE